MSCCATQKVGPTYEEFLWGKYQNFLKNVTENRDNYPKVAVDFILGDQWPVKSSSALIVLIFQFLVPFFKPKTNETPASLDFDEIQKKFIEGQYSELANEKKEDYEEVMKNTEFVNLCKKYATGLTEICSLMK